MLDPSDGRAAHLGELVLVHDLEFVIRDVSPGYARLLGYEPAELIGRPGIELTRSSPALLPHLRAALHRAGELAGTTSVWSRAGRRLHFDYVTRRVGGLYVCELEQVEEAKPALSAVDDGWLTKAEAVAYARRSARSIERAVAAGELVAGGTRGKRAFRHSALDAWLAAGGTLMLVALLVLLLVLMAVGVDADLPDIPWP